MLRVALFSDWHIGLTKEKSIKIKLAEMEAANPDLLINCGDNCGGSDGSRSTYTITKFVREVFPDLPFLSCLGNHDYWKSAGKVFTGEKHFVRHKKPSALLFNENYREILKTFKTFNVHFLNEDGLFRLQTHPGIVFMGHTLWYREDLPKSNNFNFMPKDIEGGTSQYLLQKGYAEVYKQLAQLTENDTTRVFCSHFPIIEHVTEEDRLYGGDLEFGKDLQGKYKINYFLNGHAHQRMEGPLRYEAGSDYGKPNFIILEFPIG